jgi:hypothetical protein
MGLAVHNFADSYKRIPSATISGNRANIFVLLFPYLEQQNLHDFFSAYFVFWEILAVRGNFLFSHVGAMNSSTSFPPNFPNKTTSVATIFPPK